MLGPCNAIKISVVIPTRHRDDSLGKCLARLAPGAQSLDPAAYEVIVTDDGTAGTTRQFLSSHFPWVRYFAGPKRGPAANRNNGARKAQSDFVAFVDDDCVPSLHWLSAFLSAVQADVDVYEGKTTCEAGVHSPLQISPINLQGGLLWSCNMMVRAATFWHLNGFDEEFPYATMEDIAFRDTLARLAIRSIFVADAVVDHPPRPVPTGWGLAPIHESHAIFWSKFPQWTRTTPQHMYAIGKLRVKTLLEYRWSWDSVRAFASAVSEQFLIASKMPQWRRKYAVGKSKTRP